MKECRSCKEEIKDNATACPYCGEKDQSGVYGFIGAGILIVFFGIVVLALLG